MSRTKRNIKGASCWRYPKTFQEIRDSEACRVDGIRKRKKRAKKHLPTSYDDKLVSAHYEVDFRKQKNSPKTCL